MTQTPTFPESSSWGCMYPPKWSKSTNYVSPNTTVKYYSVSAGVSKPAEVLTVMSEMAKPFLTEAERSANRRATVTPLVSDKYSLEAMLTADKIQKFTNTDFANAANILKGENKDGWNYQVAKIASGQMTLAKAVASYKSVYNNRLKKLFG